VYVPLVDDVLRYVLTGSPTTWQPKDAAATPSSSGVPCGWSGPYLIPVECGITTMSLGSWRYCANYEASPSGRVMPSPADASKTFSPIAPRYLPAMITKLLFLDGGEDASGAQPGAAMNQRSHTPRSNRDRKGVHDTLSASTIRTMGHCRSGYQAFLLDTGAMIVMLLASPLPSCVSLAQQNRCHDAPPSDSFEMPLR
jgi:hypothetical protein